MANAPIKVDAQTDRLIAHTAHLLGSSKNDIVDAAVRPYIENHRDSIQQGVLEVLGQLDGTSATSVALLAGLSKKALDDTGGVDEPE